MSEVMVTVSRGPIVESMHRGDAVVVDTSGKILYSIGDPYKTTYIRSAGKPLQALNVFLSGAMERFDFTAHEISIMCASHYGEDFHRKVIDGILDKIGLSMESLQCGSTLSIRAEYARQQISEHHVLTPANNDCSGKHTGMLASCLAKGYDISNYTQTAHPVQADILECVAQMCEIPADSIQIGIDGCSVPVHGMPLYNMALGYAKLSNPDGLSENFKDACDYVFESMNKAPEMVAGTGGFCTELMRHAGGKLIGKLGAEGVYCIGFKGMNMGLAVKIEDGNYSRALNPAVMRCLEDIGILNDKELEKLQSFREIENVNNLGGTVGIISPSFHIEKRF